MHPGVPTLEVGVSLMLRHGDAIRHADVRGADAAHCVSFHGVHVHTTGLAIVCLANCTGSSGGIIDGRAYARAYGRRRLRR